MDQLGRKFMELIRDGADPRRISSRLSRKGNGDVSESAHVNTIAAVSRYGTAAGFVIGCLFTLLIIAVIAAIMDLRPARQADIEIAARVRAAVPQPETISQSDLIARLAVPARVGALIAPLVDLDPQKESVEASWLAAIAGQHPLVVDHGRMEALAHLATALSASANQRPDLDFVMELYRALHDNDAISVLRSIVDLSPITRAELSKTDDLGRILEELAEVPRAKRHQLLGAGFEAVLPDDPDRANLLRLLPTLDMPVVRLLVRWGNAGQTQRQVLIFVLAKIAGGDRTFARMLSAFYVGNLTLQHALQSIRFDCGYSNSEACR